MSPRFLLLLISTLIWVANGIYSVYVNRLRLEQYKLTEELRKLKRENNELYWRISRILNFERGLEYALKGDYKAVKPYRVYNFKPYLEGKPLIDFYFVWIGDYPIKVAKKLGISLEVLERYNPSLRWGYLIPGRRLIYPVLSPCFGSGTSPPNQQKQSKSNHY